MGLIFGRKPQEDLKDCPDCDGKGYHECRYCEGSGREFAFNPTAPKCSECGGSGKITCRTCNGFKWVN